MKVYFDLETTGLNVNEDRIIQIGSVAEDGMKVFNSLVYTCRDIHPISQKLTGITAQKLINQPAIHQALLSWFQWLKNLGAEQITLVAHNGLGFDFPILRKEMQRCNIEFPPGIRFQFFDSLHWARKQFSKECISFSLMNLFKYVCPTEQFQAHDALQDCWALKKVVEYKLHTSNLVT